MSGLDFIANIALGSFVEKVRDGATNIGLLLLKTVQADATVRDHDDVAAMLAAGGGTANVESNATNYARKTGLTGTITIDDTNERVDVDVPDQTFTALGGGTNNTLVKALFYYQEAAADANRIPMSFHSFDLTTDGSDVTLQVAAAGFGRATG